MGDSFVWKHSLKFNNSPVLPQEAIRALFVGESGSGKTSLLYSWLLNGVLDFNRLYIFSNSIQQDLDKMLILGFNYGFTKEELLMIFSKLKHVKEKLPEEAIENLLKAKRHNNIETPIEKKVECFAYSDPELILTPENYDKNYKNLFIFDDCHMDGRMKNIIAQFFTRGRHQNFQTIFLAQDYFRVEKNGVRSNCNVIVLFDQNNASDVQNIYKQISKKDFREYRDFAGFCKQIWDQPWHYVLINKLATDMKLKYRDGLYEDKTDVNDDTEDEDDQGDISQTESEEEEETFSHQEQDNE